jgi:LacI family gluconate utilization system Gnt-I transcriptional repressor
MAIAGFNGLEIGADVVPTLTTVLSPRRKMGQLSARAILDRLEGGDRGPVHIDVGFEILRREST